MKPYYQDDLVTLYHGDSREAMNELGQFDLVLTDPPFAQARALRVVLGTTVQCGAFVCSLLCSPTKEPR